MNPDPNKTLTADNWTGAMPPLGSYRVRPYMMLAEDFYYAPPGFYDREDAFLFQPGWGGVDGSDPISFRFEDQPTVGAVREKIASLMVSSYLVQERDDAPLFHLGDEPGSIRTPYGTIPAAVIFAPHPLEDKDVDEPWENLEVLLRCVDKARSIAYASPAAVKAYVGRRLGAVTPPRADIRIHAWPDGALQIVAFPTAGRPDDNVHFTWGPTGSPLAAEREEYEVGAAGLYDVIRVPPSEDALTRAINLYA